MKSPQISILMPVKNADQFLEECLNSIVQQSFSDWELIAIDDHSTDSSYEILGEYQKKDGRIKVFKNQKNGIIHALRGALERSNGSYITRMDADDIMANIKLEELIQLLLKHKKGHVATGYIKYFSTNKKLNEGYLNYEKWLNCLTAEHSNFSEIYKECVIPSPCWMISKSDLIQIGGFNTNTYPEDYDLAFRMYYGKLKVIGSKNILHYWRDYPERTSRTNPVYSNNAFPKIKINYFLKNELNRNKMLLLWGAGKKSKAIAQLLVQNEIEFSWITNNPKKIGKTIYGRKIFNCNTFEVPENSQLIIAIASKSFQPILRLATIKDTYRFC